MTGKGQRTTQPVRDNRWDPHGRPKNPETIRFPALARALTSLVVS